MPTDISPKFFVVGENALANATMRSLSADDVHQLQLAAGYPLISVFLRTSPDLVFGSEEHARTLRMVNLTEERLVPEIGAADARAHTDPLRSLASALVGQRTGAGLALFASSDRCVAYRMPVPVDDRIVVDPTFATRDLARALNLNPPYRILLLTNNKARSFVGTGAHLREIGDGRFPAHDCVAGTERVDRKGHRLEAERSAKERQNHVGFLRRVAQSLAEDTDNAGLPLIVIASATMAPLVRKEPSLHHIDVVVGSYNRAQLSRLVQLARPGLDSHLGGIREKALARLDVASRQRRCALGIHHVWTVARRREIDLLVVDEAFRYPAWTTLGGHTLVRAFTAEMPDVLDDAVDEIIEMVQRSNGTVCFVPPGQLGSDGIAAVRSFR